MLFLDYPTVLEVLTCLVVDHELLWVTVQASFDHGVTQDLEEEDIVLRPPRLHQDINHRKLLASFLARREGVDSEQLAAPLLKHGWPGL